MDAIDGRPAAWAHIDPSWDAVVVTDREGRLLHVNARAEAMFGRSRDGLIGQPLEILLPERYRGRHVAHVAGFAASPSFRPMCLSGDIRGLHADGTEIPIAISLVPLEIGGELRIVATIRDPSTTLLSLGQIATFLDLAPDAMLVVDIGGTVRAVNQPAQRLFGRDRAGLVERPLTDLLPPTLRDRHDAHLRAYFAQPRIRSMGDGLELRALRADGEEVPVEISLAPVTTSEGLVTVAAVRDVSERRRTLDALRIADQRLQAALELARMGAWELDATTDRRTYSGGMLKLLGRVDSHAASDAFYQAVHPDDRSRVAAATAQALESGESYRIDLRVLHGDGGLRWFETSVSVERDTDGRPRHLKGLARDITEERAARDALTESRTQLRAVLTHAPDLILYLELDGTIRFINRTVPELTVDQVIGRRWRDFVPPEQRAVVDAALQRVITTGASEGVETSVVVPAAACFSNHIGPVLHDDQVVGLVVISRDISRRRAVEAQLAASDQLATLGTISAGVAHELNNPLAAVCANLEFALDDDALTLVLGTERGEALRDARDAARRLRDIVKDLKLFSRIDQEHIDCVDVVPVIESTLRLARNEIRHRALLTTDLSPVPCVNANERRLGQVILNFLVNAAQAIPEGNLEGNEIHVSSGRDAQGRVVIAISDSGVGMSPEVRARLFTPFFTTKPDGEGTGLGLAICQRIVTDLGGEITVTSEPGRGSTFRVHLPTQRRPTAASVTTMPAPVPARRRRVLAIDDDPMILRVLARSLKDHSDVVGVTKAAEFLHHLAELDPPDAILCDLMMPELSGIDLFKLVVARWPALRHCFVFVSGGAFTERTRTFLATHAGPVVEKPFDAARLKAAVEACIAAREPRVP